MPEALPLESLLSLEGRAAIVTGSTRGIGLAVARRLNEAGAAILVCGRAIAERPAIGALFSRPERIAFHSSDLGRAGEARGIVAAALSRFGRLDILVNNAGIQPAGGLFAHSEDEWSGVHSVNVVGTMTLMRAAAQAMTDPPGGAIINIASVRAVRPGAGMAAYAASKAALVSLTQSAANELGPRGIRVNAVSPGLTNRPGLAEEWPEGVERYAASAPLRRIGEPEDVADACLFLASPAARFITGQNLVVDGGITLVR